MTAPIFNAKTLTVDQAVKVMPTVRSTIMGWFRPLGLTKIQKTVVDFETVDTEIEIGGLGTWQPFTVEELNIKPEGQRSWRWFMIHTTTDLVLQTNDVIKRDGQEYMVMAKSDWSENGTVFYQVVNAYDVNGGGQ